MGDNGNNIDQEEILWGLGRCTDPVGLLPILDELGISFEVEPHRDSDIHILEWDHKTQIKMIQELTDRGYSDDYGFLNCLIRSGNIAGVRLLNNMDIIHYVTALNLAIYNGKIDIIRQVQEWASFDAKTLNEIISPIYLTTDPAVNELLKSWGVELKPRPTRRRPPPT